ncbi:Os11g0220100 [Oryza sativa Japonica Group]|uniref:Os11g0220100 protein n=1 Tax=Oryza sativa subsp. japonica TaxID=39947 RepID=Q0ITT3_ORYSJ|nr:Os11g0220100 [Oryza sativa Japonica Group]|eukprot:NP_001067519.1 Os11g0220100 [Oryza sativa Japonica Group]
MHVQLNKDTGFSILNWILWIITHGPLYSNPFFLFFNGIHPMVNENCIFFLSFYLNSYNLDNIFYMIPSYTCGLAICICKPTIYNRNKPVRFDVNVLIFFPFSTHGHPTSIT